MTTFSLILTLAGGWEMLPPPETGGPDAGADAAIAFDMSGERPRPPAGAAARGLGPRSAADPAGGGPARAGRPLPLRPEGPAAEAPAADGPEQEPKPNGTPPDGPAAEAPAVRRTPKLVVYTAAWCGPCRAFEGDVLPRLLAAGWRAGPGPADHLELVDVGPAPPPGVAAVPTFVLLGPDGREVRRHAGPLDAWGVGAFVKGYSERPAATP